MITIILWILLYVTFYTVIIHKYQSQTKIGNVIDLDKYDGKYGTI